MIEDFADSYLRGETPIPCVRCNERVKFRDLLALARDLGADALATGHYARRIVGPAGPELHRALDRGRDQSYFLFATTPAQLEFLRFPLGALAKERVRAEAARLGLAVADKPDSQDICFVPSGRYAGVIERLRPGAAEPGAIVDEESRELGRHEGVIHFTVGQRRGLGIAGARAALRALGRRRAPRGGRRPAGGAAARPRLHRPASLDRRRSARARRGAGGGGAAPLRPSRARRRCCARAPTAAPRSRCEEPEPATAPGQACVLYDADRMLGGGWITGTGRSAALAAASPDAARSGPGGGRLRAVRGTP